MLCTDQRQKETSKGGCRWCGQRPPHLLAASGSSPGTVRAVVVPEVALLAMGPISLPKLPPLVPGPRLGGRGGSELRPDRDHG